MINDKTITVRSRGRNTDKLESMVFYKKTMMRVD